VAGQDWMGLLQDGFGDVGLHRGDGAEEILTVLASAPAAEEEKGDEKDDDYGHNHGCGDLSRA